MKRDGGWAMRDHESFVACAETWPLSVLLMGVIGFRRRWPNYAFAASRFRGGRPAPLWNGVTLGPKLWITTLPPRYGAPTRYRGAKDAKSGVVAGKRNRGGD